MVLKVNTLIASFILSFCLAAFAQKTPRFELLSPAKTGIVFKNSLKESPKANVLTYEYFYNGGGVAIGDINNDGLEDIYFTSNMGQNKLYLNKGELKFKDISESAGVSCHAGWKTGVTMADVNGDGYLDIYVCLSGKGDPDKRRNKLFINNRDLTFTDKAKEFGLDDPGYTTHASFFDMDRDGDLDMYLLNHNVVVIREFEYAKARETRHPYAGHKLFRNDNGHFIDISVEAGIKGNALGFGLSVTVADINKDGWQDMYVCNDYVEPDYVYINNRNGTFTDRMTEYMQHISYFSMGCDVTDINNDEWPEIFTVDMLPEDNKRQKLLWVPDNYEHNALLVMNGFYFQNMRNMLHLNNADGTYSEIGQYSGISKTDWSWAPLFADYDNDGLKDLFITNGYYRDYTNRDFLKYKGDYYFEKARAREKADTFHLVTSMSSTPLHNYMYKNNGNLTFSDKSEEWGFNERNFSNGAAYGDLDNDGDLDLVINHLNQTAALYKNTTREKDKGQNYIQISLVGSSRNSRAIGAKLCIYANGNVQYFEHTPTRGFQSSVSDRIHIGLGKTLEIDSIKISWLSEKTTMIKNVRVNQLLRIAEENSAVDATVEGRKINRSPVFSKTKSVINYAHAEQGFNDFKRQPLLMTMLTTCGPVIATGDANSDGRLDLFIGGTQDNPGKLFFQNAEGQFYETPLTLDTKFTDADATFFDADDDKDLDLYIVSGGFNDYKENDKALQDRLYLNDGTGKFTLSSEALPVMLVSKSCVVPEDFDKDGDLDLFIGGRVIPGRYPVTPESFLLKNNHGRFVNVTKEYAAQLGKIGMVTDAGWTDINKDGWVDLIVVGEFMSIEVFLNVNGKLERHTDTFFNNPLKGLWNKMVLHDFDGDGDDDMIVGNFGLNTPLHASTEEPISLVFSDFDKNGSIDPILIQYFQGKPYPFAARDELLDQMYSMRSRFTSYASYADAQLDDMFKPDELKGAESLTATTLETSYFENQQDKFVLHSLPQQAQFSPVYAMTVFDFNKDGNMDVLLCGNQSSIRLRAGVIDANFGQLYQGNGKHEFTYIPQQQSGLSITGDVKSLQVINVKNESYMAVGVNNVGLQWYKLNRDERKQ